MRIAHIVRRYAASEWGGTETVVAATVAEQRRLGHDVRLFCTAALREADGREAFPYFYPYFPMPAADRRALDLKGGSPYAPALFAAVRDFAPELIHIHAGGRLAAAAVKLARRLGVPSVMSLHGGAAVVPPEEMRAMLRPLRHKIPYGAIADRLLGLRFDPLDRVDAIVSISRTEERRLKELYPNRTVAYLPNGISEPHPPAGVVREPRRILCVSRIDYQKNQLTLVEALAKLNASRPDSSRYRLTLVGPVTVPWYADKIKARVRELGLEGEVTLIPGLPPASVELETCFAAASVFVLPSVHEPFGIVALEAMVRGLPLVASRVGGLPDFVRDGENGLLFDPQDAAALASAIDRLSGDEAFASRLAAAGRETASHYGWPSVIDRLMSVYRQCGKAVR